MLRILEQRDLSSVTGQERDVDAVSPLGYVRYVHGYPEDLLEDILNEARRVAEYEWEARSADRYLKLRHLRAAHELIPAVQDLMYDRTRLKTLSDLAGVELEPYPITRAASHINFYQPGEVPIEHHTDGAAMVELIPLYTSGNAQGGATLIYQGTPEHGRWALQRGQTLPSQRHARVPQRTGHAVLMQGRRLLHTAQPLEDGERITLVLVMRSAAEPWKDGNSLARLLLDDPLDAVRDEWLRDQQYQADRYRARLTPTMRSTA
ncbi:hypothetical protein [Streptomyces rugosispiralis]|uniref:Fe2OG dioxygenase domain-containing protein n=1 Tax=Streptomyces rugosispiralis TaxID=2967341 RepID=A0ABT1V5I9_9ACTN|nr:hypothetical protein [Streptomyces rugosispiralis]MCQ8192656.1 hypothetical protein [Streptomyces rugosispiralis]